MIALTFKIDKRLVESELDNPTFKTINYFVQQHEKLLPRLEMLADYYEGLPHKIGEKSNVQTPHEKGQVFVNNAKYVTDIMVGITLGNPIAYSSPSTDTTAEQENNDDAFDVILENFDRINISRHDKELEKDLSVFGVGYELFYGSIVNAYDELQAVTKQTVKPCVTVIDPRGIFLVVNDTVDQEKLFAVRYKRKQDLENQEYWEFNVFTKSQVITYYSKSKQLGEGELLFDSPIINEHFFGDVPIVEYRNNEEKQGDFEQQLSQIDAINRMQSDRVQDKKNHIRAMLITYGFSLPDDDESEESYYTKKSSDVTITAPEDGRTEYVTNTFDESGVQVLYKALVDDFHKTAGVPNLNDENFAGNISGEAMKYKLLGLLMIISTKYGYFEDGVRQRLALFANFLNVQGNAIDTTGAEIKFKPNIPINQTEIIQQIRDSQDFVPLVTSLKWLPDIDDPVEQIELLNRQKEQAIKLNQSMLGQQAQDYPNSFEDKPIAEKQGTQNERA